MHGCSLVGYGGIIRNHFRETRISFAGPLSTGSVMEAKLHALWRGAIDMEKLEVVGGILEGYSKVIVSWASGTLCPWIYPDKVERICHSIASSDFLVSRVSRAVNSTVDEMVQQGLSLSLEVVNRIM